MNGPGQRRREVVDGLLLLNKPAGLSSNQALQRVKRLLNANKAGHTGSLDPAATGMLPLCFGEATKVCQFLLNADKTYRVTARLGIATDTGDAEGNEIDRQDVPAMSTADWQDLLQGFVGESLQVPPMYSALKQGGKRLYELARKGVTVAREPRPIRIHEIELLEAAAARLVFRTHCSKGTYIRVLVEDIARAAGTVAHTARLHREAVGDFQASDMLEMRVLEAAAESGSGLHEHLIAPDLALGRLPSVVLQRADAARFCSGMSLPGTVDAVAGLVRAYGEDARFLGVGEASADGSLAPKRVFHTVEKIP
jgi:tRNA pseudouridine55 synthase